MYQLYTSFRDGGVCGVLRLNEDGSKTSLLFVEDNPDYQAYLAWLDEGNEPLPPEEPPATWESIRAKRDGLIRNSDWTMIPDATVNQAAWAQYRQILRDLPQTYETRGPEAVVWPEPPAAYSPNAEKKKTRKKNNLQ